MTQQVITSDIDNISVCTQTKSKPPMVIMTLNVRMSLNSKLQNEVVMVAVLIHHKYNVDKEPPKPPYDRQFCCKFLRYVICRFSLLSLHNYVQFRMKRDKITRLVKKEEMLCNYLRYNWCFFLSPNRKSNTCFYFPDIDESFATVFSCHATTRYFMATASSGFFPKSPEYRSDKMLD